MDPTQAGVDQRDQSQEGNEHSGDVKRQLKGPSPAPRRCRINQVDAGLFHFNLYVTEGDGVASFRDKHFGEHDGGGRGHDNGGK